MCKWAPVEDGTACGGEVGTCQQGGCRVACTEQGIRDAVAAGGGPFTFDCDGPTTVVTEAEVVIDNDVVLDGDGNLTVDGNEDHRVFSVSETVTAVLRGVSVANGFNDMRGGGILSSGTLAIEDGSVSSNIAPVGSGIYNDAGTLSISKTVVFENVISEFQNPGGAIYNDGVMSLVESTIYANGSEAERDLGACGIANLGELTVVRSTISDNPWGGLRGFQLTTEPVAIVDSTVANNGHVGISVLGPATISGSTISRNTQFLNLAGELDGFGGGLYVGGTEPVSLANSTISDDNRWSPSITARPDSEIRVTNTIIDGWCRSTTESSAPDFDSSYSLESPGNTCGFDPDGTDLVNVSADDLKLGPLQDNGGPTMTHALGAGSVAIDWIPAVDCDVTEDQRGEPRPGGTMCDVGAFEVQP